MAEITIKGIMNFFNEGLAADDIRNKPTRFASEWKALSDQDKADIKAGLENETLTY